MTMVLTAVLAIKYILFDRDEHLESDDVPVTMATEPPASAAETADKLTTATVMNGSVSVEPPQQINHVADEALLSETTDDIIPTGLSLIGTWSYYAYIN